MRPLIADVGLSLWRLLPGNPILVRVVRGGSKRTQHFWARTGYLVALLFVVLVLQWSDDAGDSLVERAKASSQMFKFISVLQLAMMCFLAPAFTAGAISQERDAETYNVLLTTPLTNAQIVLGSLMSRLFFVLMLLLSGLPIFCITMLYGGVTSREIFTSFGVAGATAVLTGSLAITISVMRVGSRGTVFSFYAGIAVFIVAGLALGMWPETHVKESIPVGETTGMSWLAPFHPFLALRVALKYTPPPDPAAVAHYGWPWAGMLASPHTAYVWMTLIASVLMVALATLFVRRGAKVGEVTWWRRLLPKRVRITPEGVRKRRARRVWANPVAWREAATRSSAASSTLARFGFVICGIVAGAALMIAYHTGAFPSGPGARLNPARYWLIGIVLVEFVTIALLAVNAAATSITRERESGTMELLLVTPLTSKYILMGKLRGLVSFTVPLMAVPVGTVLVAALYDLVANPPGPPIVTVASAIALPPLMLVYSALICILGLQMSLKSKRTMQAVLTSLAILVVVGFGLGLCALGAVEGVGSPGALLAPLTLFTGILFVLDPDGLTERIRNTMPMSVQEAQWFLIFGTAIAVVLYGAIVSAIYKSMIRDFDMIVRKQSR